MLSKKQKYTKQQMDRLEYALVKLLDSANEGAEITADIVGEYSRIVPSIDKLGILDIIQQQTKKNTKVGIAEWLVDEIVDFDGRHMDALLDEVEGQIFYTDTKDTSVADYLRVDASLALEDEDFVKTTSEELVAGYKKALDTPGAEVHVEFFKVALAKRMLSRPNDIPTIRKVGGFSSDDLHEIIISSYTSKDLLDDITKQQKNKDTQAFFEHYDLFWRGHTDDPDTGIKVNSYFNSFTRIHKIPFGNVHTAFSQIYTGNFDHLAGELDDAVTIKTELA